MGAHRTAVRVDRLISWFHRESRPPSDSRMSSQSPSTERLEDVIRSYCRYDINEFTGKFLLVVGECGDGKTTLVNGLRDPSKDNPNIDDSDHAKGRADLDAEGVTKQLMVYPGKDLTLPDGRKCEVTIIDTPGVGDADVNVMKLMAMLESALGSLDLHCVLVTNKITDGRIRMGARVAKKLVEKGFVGGENKWDNILLVGTMNDVASDAQKKYFAGPVDPPKPGQKVKVSIKESIFDQAEPKGEGQYCMVCQDDYGSLLEAVTIMPNMVIKYTPPPVEEMAAAFAEDIGIEPSEFVGKFENLRQQMQAMQEEFAERQRHDMNVQQDMVAMQREMMANAAAEQRRHEAVVRELTEKYDSLKEKAAADKQEHETVVREHETVVREHEAVVREHERVVRELTEKCQGQERQIARLKEEAAAAVRTLEQLQNEFAFRNNEKQQWESQVAMMAEEMERMRARGEEREAVRKQEKDEMMAEMHTRVADAEDRAMDRAAHETKMKEERMQAQMEAMSGDMKRKAREMDREMSQMQEAFEMERRKRQMEDREKEQKFSMEMQEMQQYYREKMREMEAELNRRR